MRICRKFSKISVLHEQLYYLPESFIYNENNVTAIIYRRDSRKWFAETKLITLALAKELSEYAKRYK